MGRARAGEQGGGKPQTREHGGGAVARAPPPARPDAGALRRRAGGERLEAHADVAFWRSWRRNGRRAWFSIRPGPGARGRTTGPLELLPFVQGTDPPFFGGSFVHRSPEQKATLLLRRHHCSTTASRPRGRNPPAGSTSHPAGRRVRASARPPSAARPAAPRSHPRGVQEGGAPPSLSHLLEHLTLRQRAPGVRGRGARRHGGHRAVGHADHRARHLLPARQRAPQAVGAAGDPVSARAVEATSLPLASTSSTSFPPPLKAGAPVG